MLNNFLILYQSINIIMQNSNNKAFKDKKLIILKEEIVYLKNTLLILKVFIKATNCQGLNPTMLRLRLA